MSSWWNMLGALGALIRKDERTLFNKSTLILLWGSSSDSVPSSSDSTYCILRNSDRDGLYVAAPKLSQEIEEEFTEELGSEIQQKLLDRWPFDEEDASWSSIKQIFRESRLRILYTSEESHEWVLYTNIGIAPFPSSTSSASTDSAQSTINGSTSTITNGSTGTINIADDLGNYTLSDRADIAVDLLGNPNQHDTDCRDLQCLGGVYQKFNFEFGDGKFHDIVSMGSTRNMGWSVRDSSCFEPHVLCSVGSILNLQRKINSKYDLILPAEIWHIILGFGIDCFEPITQMVCVDV